MDLCIDLDCLNVGIVLECIEIDARSLEGGDFSSRRNVLDLPVLGEVLKLVSTLLYV